MMKKLLLKSKSVRLPNKDIETQSFASLLLLYSSESKKFYLRAL